MHLEERTVGSCPPPEGGVWGEKLSIDDGQENANDEEWPENWHDPSQEGARRTVAGVIREVRLDTAHA